MILPIQIVKSRTLRGLVRVFVLSQNGEITLECLRSEYPGTWNKKPISMSPAGYKTVLNSRTLVINKKTN